MSTNRIQQSAAVVIDEVEDIIALSRLVRFEARKLAEGPVVRSIQSISDAQDQLARLGEYLAISERRLRRYFDLHTGAETAVVGIPAPIDPRTPATN